MKLRSGSDEHEMRDLAWLWRLCAALCLVSALIFLWAGDWASVLVCLGTVILVLIPPAAVRLGLRFSRGFLVFCVLYAMGPMLGKAYKLYYLTNWWDKLLHTCGGVAFAAVGTCLAAGLNGGRDTSPVLLGVFGLCFSIAVSAVWELFEFGVDWLFAADMQNDTVVHAIHSHFLSDTPGVLRSIGDIREVTLDGVPLEAGGYLDIGLIDTMQDVLVETVGALGFFLWSLAGRKPVLWIEKNA